MQKVAKVKCTTFLAEDFTFPFRRLSLVNSFVFLLPMKNIVPGKKKIFEGGKEISL
jgi:hypothetical protein